MTDITITYNEGRGKMIIYPDEFFPCSEARMRKLFSIMRLDYENHEQLIHEVLNLCKEKKEICESNRKIYANKYTTIRTERIECEQCITERKAVNGVPLTKDQIKKERERKKIYLQSEKEYDREFKQNSRKAKQLNKNIEQIQDYIMNGNW